MGKEVLVRNIPAEIQCWIKDECGTRHMTQQEFVLGLVHQAYQRDQAERMPLFAAQTEQTGSPLAVASTAPFFRFIDLFAGIGGFRIALERLGGKCVFSSEWDKYSQKTYRAWFGETPQGDIRKIKPAAIPDHDILAAGFPCQPFSIAGVSKKNSLGHPHGFKCESQGNLFFNVATIAEERRPPVLFLENVKNLQSHDHGRTWTVIRDALLALEYVVFAQVIDAADWVPQHRERIYVVCFDKRVFGEAPPFEFPAPPSGPRRTVAEILEKSPEPKYTLSDHLWQYLQDYAEGHKAKGNGFGFGLVKLDGIARTLSARYYKDGSEILVPQQNKSPRRLTPRECARLMGYADELSIVVSDTQAYRQFGNSVVPLVVEAVAKQILKVIAWNIDRTGNGCLVKRGEEQLVAGESTGGPERGVSNRATRNRGRDRKRKRDTEVHLAE